MTCIFCQDKEVNFPKDGDHVPPRFIFTKLPPPNLRKVPSCKECNNSFSKDEEYFRLVITGFFSHTTEANEIFDSKISRSFDRRPNIEEAFWGLLKVNLENNRPYVDFDIERIKRVASKICIGLSYLELGRIPDQSETFEMWLFSKEEYSKINDDIFIGCLQNNHGAPSFKFRFKPTFRQFNSIWEMEYYESVIIVGAFRSAVVNNSQPLI